MPTSQVHTHIIIHWHDNKHMKLTSGSEIEQELENHIPTQVCITDVDDNILKYEKLDTK